MPSTTQPAPETDEKKSRGLGSYVLWAFVAVMVYGLSIGPVFKLVADNVITGEILVIYRPVEWAYDRTILHKPIGIYLHLWEPDVFGKNGDCLVH